jgi:hypothetical protein
VHLTEGHIFLERAQFTEASARFDRVEQTLSLCRANPAFGELLSYVWAFQALALAGLGHMAQARLRFARARPRLEAHRERALLERCSNAVAPP